MRYHPFQIVTYCICGRLLRVTEAYAATSSIGFLFQQYLKAYIDAITSLLVKI